MFMILLQNHMYFTAKPFPKNILLMFWLNSVYDLQFSLQLYSDLKYLLDVMVLFLFDYRLLRRHCEYCSQQ